MAAALQAAGDAEATRNVVETQSTKEVDVLNMKKERISC